MWQCPECSIEFKRRGFHMTKHGQKMWNTGLTKRTHPGLATSGAKRLGKSWGKQTEETKHKIAKASKEHWQNPEYREKISVNRSKPIWSEESRRRVSECAKKWKVANPGLVKRIAEMGGKACKGTSKTITQKTIDGRKRAVIKQRQYHGEKASNWQGGKSFEEYGRYWTDGFKDEIRERDGFTCLDCGVTQEQLVGFLKQLDVHHKDHNKNNGHNDNMATLCRSCHQKRHRAAE